MIKAALFTEFTQIRKHNFSGSHIQTRVPAESFRANSTKLLMPIITVLILILMFITPTISVMAVMLQATTNKQTNRQPSSFTRVLMVLFAIGIHLLGARGLLSNYLNLSGSSALIAMCITTVITLLLGVALGLLVQDLRQPKT
jgi:succinate dehydrogenase hydrophobic anchor subunit